MGFTGTPAAEYTEAAVLELYDPEIIGIGQYNRRKIAGTQLWSEHSWGNGLDLHVSVGRANPAEKANGDKVAAWLRDNKEELGIRALLWWVTSHFDHIHVDFWPRGHGTPPLTTTGVGQFRYSDGRIETARIQDIPKEGPGLDMPLSPEDLIKIGEVVDAKLNARLTQIAIPGEPNRKTYQEMVNAFHAYSDGRKLFQTNDEVHEMVTRLDETLATGYADGGG